MNLIGLSHSSLACADAGRSLDFYSEALGLSLVRDDTDGGRRRLIFTDEPEQSDTYLVLTARPDQPAGRTGIGALHHTAFIAESTNAQLKWKRWLTDRGVNVLGPYDRGYFRSIYFRDPDRNILEIATRWPGLTEDEDEEELGSHEIIPAEEFTPQGRDEAAIRAQTWPEPLKKIGGDMDLRGLHHVSAICAELARTAEFYTGVLGLRLLKRTRSYDDNAVPHWYFGVAAGYPGGLVTFFEYPPGKMPQARSGPGVPMGFGFAVEDAGQLEHWRNRLESMGVSLMTESPFAAAIGIEFRDPNGILVSISRGGRVQT